jgi:hypothetical protein
MSDNGEMESLLGIQLDLVINSLFSSKKRATRKTWSAQRRN